MKKLSGFDLGMIIASVVVALLGGAAWYFLSDQLETAEDNAHNAYKDFTHYSSTKDAMSKGDLVINKSNVEMLHANIDLLKSQLDPIVPAKVLPKENKLPSVEKEDPVSWKHKLDDEVKSLTNQAQIHGVGLPPNFYFAFSRYLNQNPNDQQTIVLGKQLLCVQEIATILIDAPVKAIQTIRRTYEEDPHNANSGSGSGPATEADHINGSSIRVGGGIYTAYPFEIEFDTSTDSFRKVIDGLVQSPYVFVIRSLTVQNSQPDSPQLGDLDRLAGPPPASVVDSSPGATAAVVSNQPPQFLFGNATIHVKARIDVIEWNAPVSQETPAPGNPPGKTPRARGGNR